MTTTLETGGEDQKTTLETGGEDVLFSEHAQLFSDPKFMDRYEDMLSLLRPRLMEYTAKQHSLHLLHSFRV